MSPSEPVETTRLTVTESAKRLVERIAAERGEAVAVELNDGCCGGMGPVLIPKAMVGVGDVRIGEVRPVEVYTPHNRAENFEGYEITIDVREARPGEGTFSLERPSGYRLIARESRE